MTRSVIQKMLFSTLFIILSFGLVAELQAAIYKVQTATEFKTRVETGLTPNDTILLANGTWRDADLVFKGQGTATQPIVLAAETSGKVWLEGASLLRLSGAFLVVNGLHFRNGGVANAVIEYRTSANDIANDCRVTNCVIDNYNVPDRTKESIWVQFYGKRNRLDHCYIAGKKTEGVTLAVHLNDARHQENVHRIDHNIFGERPPLGSNGGETIRIGVSTYSLSNSKTIVEDNYFYRCSGEVEVISVKSCENVFRRNVFYECEGSLVLRHGNRNLVEGNYFIGNNKPHTGGVRVINAGHRIVNNYFENLKGARFRSAFAIMNGVPNSSLNRYHQVHDVTFAFNTFVNCDNIALAVGADNERTARPLSTVFVSNVILNTNKTDSIYTTGDDISGITFLDNQVKINTKTVLPKGFQTTDFQGFIPKNTLTKSTETAFVTTDILGNARDNTTHAGAFEAAPKTPFDFSPTTMTGIGTDFFTPNWANLTFPMSKRTIPTPPQYKALEKAIGAAEAGDIIELTDTATYFIDATLSIKKPITLRAKAGLSHRPLLKFKAEKGGLAFISLENGGNLRLNGIDFDGTVEAGTAECAIRTSLKPTLEPYQLFVENCTFSHFTDGRKSVFKAHKGTFADTIQFTNCLFTDVSGEALSLAAERDDKGIYNAEHVILSNCAFVNLPIGALDLYRGGNDESTLGPFLTIDHCTFHNVANVELCYVLKLIGVQQSEIKNSLFSESGQAGRIARYEDFRGTRNYIHHCNVYKSGRVESFYPTVVGEGMTNFKPEFRWLEVLDMRQKDGSPLRKIATDGKDLGVF